MPLPDNFERVVLAQAQTRFATVERHDYRFNRPQDTVFRSSRAFLDLALSHRPKDATGAFINRPDAGRLPIGDIMFIPANWPVHSQWGAGRQSSVCLEFEPNLDEAGLDLSHCIDGIDSALDIRSAAIRALLEKLAAEIEQPGFASGLLVEALCIELAVELNRHLHNRNSGMVVGGALSRAQMALIDEQIETAGAVPSVNELAALCSVSPRHFFRLFRNTTRMTLTDYAAERRLTRAKQLLADPSLLVKEISWRCGFSNSASFSAAFRQATGVTPREYRLSKSA